LSGAFGDVSQGRAVKHVKMLAYSQRQGLCGQCHFRSMISIIDLD